MPLLLSLDFGTNGVRAGVYDTEARAMTFTAERPYATSHPQQGWAEQSPDAWWEAFLGAARAALDGAGRRDIAALCVATTSSTVVACRADGQPLRPAILWMDCRAAVESQFTETVRHPVLQFSGGGDAVEWLVPKAMWLERHEPEIYRAADVLCEAVDWINFRLTGEWTGSRLNAVCKWNYDPLERRFPSDLFARFGVPDLAHKLPNRIVPVGGPVGRLQRAVAEQLGIAGTPLVAGGGIDAHMGVLGAGTVSPGGMLLIGGTSAVHLIQTDRRRDVGGIWGPYPSALVDGLWLMEGGQVSAGSILSWLCEKIFGLDAEGHKKLLADAARLDPATGDLVTLDYWMGNRTPYRDPKMRGAILGLSLFHDRAALYRSAVDAVALGSANVVAGLVQQGVEIERLVIAGGIVKNPLWLSATIDAIGLPAHLVRNENLSLVGGAVSAACALGLFDSLESASTALAATGELVEPSSAATRRYAEKMTLYREATLAAAPITHKLAEINLEKRLQ